MQFSIYCIAFYCFNSIYTSTEIINHSDNVKIKHLFFFTNLLKNFIIYNGG